MGLQEDDWNKMIAAAEEDQQNDDNRHLEQEQHNESQSKPNDEKASILPSGTYESPDLGLIQLGQCHPQQQSYSHVGSKDTIKVSGTFQPTGTSPSPTQPSSSREYGYNRYNRCDETNNKNNEGKHCENQEEEH